MQPKLRKKEGVAMARPIVAYIEDENGHWGDDNVWRDALCYFLRERCGCEVISYYSDYDFEKDRSRLKRYAKYGLLILVIVKQQDYSEDQHQRVIAMTRKSLSKKIPIVVLPGLFSENRFASDSNDALVYAYQHTDTKLVSLVKGLVSHCSMPIDWLGAETQEDRKILMTQLESAYAKHYLTGDSNGLFGVPDHNHQIVAEALRIKLLPSEFIREEFDDAISGEEKEMASVDSSVFWAEVDRIRSMTDKERKEFDHTLQRARGWEPCETGGIYVMRASCGDDVRGFAIDPITLETLTTYRFGEHHLVGDKLARRIWAIEMMAGKASWADDSKYKRRLITGLIFTDIEGFTTPILQLYSEGRDYSKVFTRVASLLMKEQKFIPVTFDGHLIEG